MRRFSCQVVCAALVACVAAGCGSSQTRHTVTTQRARVVQPPPHATSDPQRASVGLLPREVIPTKVSEASDRRNRARCGPRALFRHLATGVATSPRYGIQGGQVQQTVLIFRDARTATRAFDRLTSTANTRCLDQSARSEVSTEVSAKAGPVTEQILNLEPHGQQGASYRMNTLVPAGIVSIDILINRIGRSISSVSVIWSQKPPTLEFQEVLVAQIASRLQRLLA